MIITDQRLLNLLRPAIDGEQLFLSRMRKNKRPAQGHGK